MSAQRVSLKIHPAAATGIICVCLLVLGYYLWPVRELAGQILLLGIVYLLIRHGAPMTNWWRRLPWSYRVVLVALLAAVVAGHFSFDNRRWFPFVTWEIFPSAREEDPVTCRELLAETTHGKKIRLLVEQLFPSIVQFDLPGGDGSPAMRHLVRALARRYNLLHPDDTVQRVDLVRVSVHLRPPAAPPSCEFLNRFAVSSDPSN